MNKYVFFFTCIILSSCTSLKKIGSDYIELQRTPCFGSCPDYTLTVFENGKYVLKGSGFQLKKEVEKGEISPAEVSSLFKVADDIDLYSYPNNIDDVCVSTMSDSPATKITVKRGSRKKKVREQECALLIQEFMDSYRYSVENGTLTQQELDSIIVQNSNAKQLSTQFHDFASQIDSVTNSKALISRIKKYQ